MDKPKVCRGCFAEWELEYGQCPRCGWQPEEKPLVRLQWKTGDVLRKRYLVGKLFYSSETDNLVVWRIYDNFLGVPGFALLKDGGTMEDLVVLSKRLQSGKASEKKEVVVQTIQKIGQQPVLFFSLRNRYMEEQDFRQLLQGEGFTEKMEMPPEKPTEGKEQVLPTGSLIEDRYRILSCLGIGGFGITYLCQDVWLHRLVTLKEYFPAEWAVRDDTYVTVKSSNLLQAYRYGMQSYLKEIKITGKFIHTPHMLTIYDAFEENDTIYMVLEYVSGVSIGREIRGRAYEPYSTVEVLEIVNPVMDALEEIHRRQIIHSDISPGNILRDDNGEICLIDMGAAKYNLDTQPMLGAAFLKIDYAAPEQYRTARAGKPEGEGPWTDIYGLGATMYYLLTGKKPTDVISRLSGKDTDLAPALEGKLEQSWIDLLQKAMELDATKRFSSVSAFRTEMIRIKE
jgi:hypothetical protein